MPTQSPKTQPVLILIFLIQTNILMISMASEESSFALFKTNLYGCCCRVELAFEPFQTSKVLVNGCL